MYCSTRHGIGQTSIQGVPYLPRHISDRVLTPRSRGVGVRAEFVQGVAASEVRELCLGCRRHGFCKYRTSQNDYSNLQCVNMLYYSLTASEADRHPYLNWTRTNIALTGKFADLMSWTLKHPSSRPFLDLQVSDSLNASILKALIRSMLFCQSTQAKLQTIRKIIQFHQIAGSLCS